MSLDNFSWAILCTLAVFNGWVPQGTSNPDPSSFPNISPKDYAEIEKRWPGMYQGSNGQTVSAEDAKNMGKALQVGIETIRNGERDDDLMKSLFPEEIKKFFEKIPPGDEVRRYIIEISERFIEFCKEAPFIIA